MSESRPQQPHVFKWFIPPHSSMSAACRMKNGARQTVQQDISQLHHPLQWQLVAAAAVGTRSSGNLTAGGYKGLNDNNEEKAMFLHSLPEGEDNRPAENSHMSFIIQSISDVKTSCYCAYVMI